MGCNASELLLERPQCYIEPGSNDIVNYQPNSARISRSDQFTTVNRLESDDYFHPNEICCVIDARWLGKWLDYCSATNNHKKPRFPGKITNDRLVDQRTMDLYHYLEAKKDFRTVKVAVWRYLFQIYGVDGPIIFLTGNSRSMIRHYDYMKRTVS